MKPQDSEGMHPEPKERRVTERNVEIIMWGLVLIWIGVVAYSNSAGLFASSSWFDYLIAGLGAIFFADGLLCYFGKIGHHLVRMVGGAFVLAIGVLNIFDTSIYVSSSILIAALGVVLIGYAVIRAKS